MSDVTHTAAPAATAAAGPVPVVAHAHAHSLAPSRSKVKTRGFGFAILMVVILYFLGVGNLEVAGDNLGKRLIDATDPQNTWGPWELPNLNLDLIFMVLVIVIAVCFIFNPWSTKVTVVEKKAEAKKGHDHAHH